MLVRGEMICQWQLGTTYLQKASVIKWGKIYTGYSCLCFCWSISKLWRKMKFWHTESVVSILFKKKKKIFHVLIFFHSFLIPGEFNCWIQMMHSVMHIMQCAAFGDFWRLESSVLYSLDIDYLAFWTNPVYINFTFQTWSLVGGFNWRLLTSL